MWVGLLAACEGEVVRDARSVVLPPAARADATLWDTRQEADVVDEVESDLGPEVDTIEPDIGPDSEVADPVEVVSVTPADGARDVAREASVTVVLSRAAPDEGGFAVTTDAGEVAGTVAWSEDRTTLTFTPDEALGFRAWVRVRAAAWSLDTAFVTVGPRAPAPFQRSEATLGRMRAAIDQALVAPGLSGRTFGGIIVDLESGHTVWENAPDRLMIPASNTKVFTTATAMAKLGGDHRALTRVIARDPIDANGTLTGDLALHSEHDFTWSRWFYGDPREPLNRIADALWSRGLRKVVGDVGIWGAYLYEGYHYGSYDPAPQRVRAGDAFIAALRARGITVSGARVDHATMEVPAGEVLARWESIPLWVQAWAINRRSHNEMADILARHVGYLVKGASDYPSGGAAMKEWLAQGGVDVTGFVIEDGSGLDLDNRVSARQLVGVYRAMLDSPPGPAWMSSLSVAGVVGAASVDGNEVAIVTTNASPYNGTLAGRMTGGDTAGRVFGKSGTNAGITTTGVLFHKYDGRRYAYAFQMNNLPSGTADLARVTQDALVVQLAKDWDQRGARPAAPTLGCVRGRDDGRIGVGVAAVAGLTPEEGKAGYWIETSADGLTWDVSDRVFSLVPSVVIDGPLEANEVVYVRARIETAAGLSDPSDVYGARPAAAENTPKVLLVDADDRWQRQPTNENSRGAAHAFLAEYAAAMPDGVAFDACPNEAVTDGGVALMPYDAVVWAAGEEATTDESISAAEQGELAAYLGSAGALFVSGAELAWELDPAGDATASASDKAFYQTWLGAAYASDDAGVYAAEGVADGIFADLTFEKRLGFWTPGAIFVAYPDVLRPLGEAKACLAYTGNAGVACVQMRTSFDLVSFGFPFESIDTAAVRAVVMERVMRFFGLVP